MSRLQLKGSTTGRKYGQPYKATLQRNFGVVLQPQLFNTSLPCYFKLSTHDKQGDGELQISAQVNVPNRRNSSYAQSKRSAKFPVRQFTAENKRPRPQTATFKRLRKPPEVQKRQTEGTIKQFVPDPYMVGRNGYLGDNQTRYYQTKTSNLAQQIQDREDGPVTSITVKMPNAKEIAQKQQVFSSSHMHTKKTTELGPSAAGSPETKDKSFFNRRNSIQSEEQLALPDNKRNSSTSRNVSNQQKLQTLFNQLTIGGDKESITHSQNNPDLEEVSRIQKSQEDMAKTNESLSSYVKVFSRKYDSQNNSMSNTLPRDISPKFQNEMINNSKELGSACSSSKKSKGSLENTNFQPALFLMPTDPQVQELSINAKSIYNPRRASLSQPKERVSTAPDGQGDDYFPIQQKQIHGPSMTQHKFFTRKKKSQNSSLSSALTSKQLRDSKVSLAKEVDLKGSLKKVRKVKKIAISSGQAQKDYKRIIQIQGFQHQKETTLKCPQSPLTLVSQEKSIKDRRNKSLTLARKNIVERISREQNYKTQKRESNKSFEVTQTPRDAYSHVESKVKQELAKQEKLSRTQLVDSTPGNSSRFQASHSFDLSQRTPQKDKDELFKKYNPFKKESQVRDSDEKLQEANFRNYKINVKTTPLGGSKVTEQMQKQPDAFFREVLQDLESRRKSGSKMDNPAPTITSVDKPKFKPKIKDYFNVQKMRKQKEEKKKLLLVDELIKHKDRAARVGQSLLGRRLLKRF